MPLRVAVLNREARSTRVAPARQPCTGHPAPGHHAQAGRHRSLPPRTPPAPRPPRAAGARPAPRWPAPRPPRAAGARGQALGRGGHRLQHSALRRRRPRRLAHGASSHDGVTVGSWWGHGGATVGSTAWSSYAHAHAHVHMPCAHLRASSSGAGRWRGGRCGSACGRSRGGRPRQGAPWRRATRPLASALCLPSGGGRAAPSYLPTDY